MIMTRKEFEDRITEAVAGYIADEETYDDNAQLQIDPETLKVTVVDSEDAAPEGIDTIDSDDKTSFDEGVSINPDVTGMDYYDVMDFVRMSPDRPGKWVVDSDAVASVAEEYVK